MAKYVVIEFLFDGEPVCPWCNGYSFCLDLKPMNGGWMGFACISVKKLQWVSVLIFLMFFPFALIFVIALLLVVVVIVVVVVVVTS